MPDISKIQLENNTYDIKDQAARTLISNLDDEIDELIPDTLVVFGDSWSDLAVTDSIWSTNAADTLNLTLKNYAVNGATFVANPNKLISTQIQTFRDDTTVNKNKVKYVVFMGGINDYLQSITRNVLASTIATSVNALKTLCPQAKIIYVSNCGYPYTLAQSQYWYDVHNYLTASTSIGSLNIDGIIGSALWNTANYYHLTQNGQKWLAKQVVSTLSGGEITYFNDSRSFYTTKGDITYTAIRLKDIVSVSVEFVSKQADTSFDFSFPNDVALPYYGAIFGGGGAGNNTLQYGIAANAIAVRAANATYANNTKYYASIVLPLYGL